MPFGRLLPGRSRHCVTALVICALAQCAFAAEPAVAIVLGSRTATEDWAAAAARVRSSSDWAKWVVGEQSAVDGWMARNPERADLVGGWVHDYVDPATQRPLQWSASSPQPPAGKSKGEQRFEQAWVAHMREVNVQRTQAAARLYRLTGEERYAQWAAQQLDFYAVEYLRWPLRTENGRGRMFRHGLDEAVSSFALLDAARLLERYAGAQRSDRWRDGLFYPMAENLRSVTTPRSNIALWQYAAIAAIAMRFQDLPMLDNALDSADGLNATLAAGLTSDDVWIEGSFSYNNYVVTSLDKLLLHASLEGDAQRVATVSTSVVRALLGPLPFRFPDGSLPTPSDSAPGLMAIDSALYLRLYRVLPTYFGLERAAHTYSWDTLIDPPAALPASKPVLPPVTTRSFPAVRMAVLRFGDWQAFVHYGQATPNHAQEEALAYELQDGDTPISRDAGTTAYSSAYHIDYFRRAAGNTVPLIDGTGEMGAQPGEVTGFSVVDSRLVAVQPSYQPGARAERSYQVSVDGFDETTRIDLDSGKAKRLGAVFYTTCAVVPVSGLDTAPAGFTPPANVTTAYWKDVAAFTASGSWSLRVSCPGQHDYLLRVQGPAQQRVFIGTAPDTPLPAKRNFVYYDALDHSASFALQIRHAR